VHRSFRVQLTLLIGLTVLAVAVVLAYAIGDRTGLGPAAFWLASAALAVAAMLTAWFTAGRFGRTLRAMNDHLARREQDLQRANEQLESRVNEGRAELERVQGELAEAGQRLQQLAHHDDLTGLANRHGADELLAAQLAQHRRHQRPFGVMLCDVDHLQRINDEHGRAAGDLVLQAVALAIRNTLRDSDIAARFSGEEFLVVLPETDSDGLAVAAEKLRAAVAALDLDDVGRCTVSIGSAVALVGRNRAADLLRRADEALYAAKAGGRNRVVISSGMEADPARRPGWLQPTAPAIFDERQGLLP
jgi:diguanylate cyclase (GGDEF)-like protein